MTPRLAGMNEISSDIRIGIGISKNNFSLASASGCRLAHQSFALMSKPIACKLQCAVKGAFSQWVKFPPGTYRSSR